MSEDQFKAIKRRALDNSATPEDALALCEVIDRLRASHRELLIENSKLREEAERAKVQP